MRMLSYLGKQYPKAHITLHAGELWPGLVKPEDLSFHIGEAVNVAKAERIGHGVDLVHEDNWQQLTRTMARRETAVEVPLTSNAQILGVKGDDHPFNTYRAHGVPVVLATDDPGISRTDISHEFQYASTTYRLRYPELKDLARASPSSTPSSRAAACGAATRRATATGPPRPARRNTPAPAGPAAPAAASWPTARRQPPNGTSNPPSPPSNAHTPTPADPGLVAPLRSRPRPRGRGRGRDRSSSGGPTSAGETERDLRHSTSHENLAKTRRRQEHRGRTCQ